VTWLNCEPAGAEPSCGYICDSRPVVQNQPGTWSASPADQYESRPLMSRNRMYFALMGTCVGLVVVAWTVVRGYSLPAAIIISVAAMAIPPIAAILANAGDEGSRRQ
jgi:hypothetical protein